MTNTNTFMHSVNVQAAVIMPDALNTWVDFDVDIRPLGGKYTTSNDAISDILMEIAEELSVEGLVFPGCFSNIGGAYCITLTNGVRIFLGKFWPDEVGLDGYVRMWCQENCIDVYQFESLIVKCAMKKRPL